MAALESPSAASSATWGSRPRSPNVILSSRVVGRAGSRSNVARPARESRHNMKYWRDGAWLGFGCGAHSTRGALRWKNVAATAEYVAGVAGHEDLAVERQTRSAREQLEDALFTGLRLSAGVDCRRLGTCYGVDVWERYGDALRPHIDAGRLVFSDDQLRLTREGMLVANDVMTVFV